MLGHVTGYVGGSVSVSVSLRFMLGLSSLFCVTQGPAPTGCISQAPGWVWLVGREAAEWEAGETRLLLGSSCIPSPHRLPPLHHLPSYSCCPIGATTVPAPSGACGPRGPAAPPPPLSQQSRGASSVLSLPGHLTPPHPRLTFQLYSQCPSIDSLCVNLLE